MLTATHATISKNKQEKDHLVEERAVRKSQMC